MQCRRARGSNSIDAAVPASGVLWKMQVSPLIANSRPEPDDGSDARYAIDAYLLPLP